jgi:hypothetical protein
MDLLKDGGKSKKEMDEYCEQKGFAGWFETSAKDNLGIDQATKFLIQKMLENEHTKAPVDPNIVNPTAAAQTQRTSKSPAEEEKGFLCCK